MKTIGPFTRYGWGWDLQLPFGWWLTFSRYDDGRPCLYISSDATPPNPDFNRGFYLWRGRA